MITVRVTLEERKAAMAIVKALTYATDPVVRWHLYKALGAIVGTAGAAAHRTGEGLAIQVKGDTK
jgi:hypothetical protein